LLFYQKRKEIISIRFYPIHKAHEWKDLYEYSEDYCTHPYTGLWQLLPGKKFGFIHLSSFNEFALKKAANISDIKTSRNLIYMKDLIPYNIDQTKTDNYDLLCEKIINSYYNKEKVEEEFRTLILFDKNPNIPRDEIKLTKNLIRSEYKEFDDCVQTEATARNVIYHYTVYIEKLEKKEFEDSILFYRTVNKNLKKQKSISKAKDIGTTTALVVGGIF
jgi:hypothetical protein